MREQDYFPGLEDPLPWQQRPPLFSRAGWFAAGFFSAWMLGAALVLLLLRQAAAQ